jgi:hypothetical protein
MKGKFGVIALLLSSITFAAPVSTPNQSIRHSHNLRRWNGEVEAKHAITAGLIKLMAPQ